MSDIYNGVWKGNIEANIENIEKDINEIKTILHCIQEKVTTIEKEVEVLKYKSSIWGFIAGLLPALAAFLYWLLKK